MNKIEWGNGNSFSKVFIDSLTDEEVLKAFTLVPMCQKIIFLKEIKKRKINQIVVDLSPDYDEEMLKDTMSFFSELSENDEDSIRVLNYVESFEIFFNKLRKVGGSISIYSVPINDYVPSPERSVNDQKEKKLLKQKQGVKHYQSFNKRKFG